MAFADRIPFLPTKPISGTAEPDSTTGQIPEVLTRAEVSPAAGKDVDVLVIGAGPTGLACGIDAQRAGFNTLVIDKGCLVNSLYNYPANMTFFTTPELLEIGDLPFSTAHQKPTREEALEYYRKVAEHYRLPARAISAEWRRLPAGTVQFHFCRQRQTGQDFRLLEARKLVVSTGYYDLANQLGVPGEDLPKVFHYFREPHPFFDADVMVVGGKNSAAISALDLWRHGARVTLVHRGPRLHNHVKYWILPDIENRIKNGEIKAYFNSSIQKIDPESVAVETADGMVAVKNDFVFALVGYHPDYDFLQAMGIELSSEQCRPVCDPATLESNVPGIYVAGVIVAGSRTNEIFIENGRFHGKLIAEDLKRKLSSKASE